jgi:cell wall-associated NlpC family hydrolase
MFEDNPSSRLPARGGRTPDDLTAGSRVGPETNAVVAAAQAEIGKPYAGPLVGQPDSARWGSVGWDCSSFVAGMYERAYSVKLTAFTDAAYCQTIAVDNPSPGDIVFYRYQDPSQPGVTYPHMGIYLAPGRVLDARVGDGVGIHDDVRGAAREYRRVIPPGREKAPARAGRAATGPTESPLGGGG